MSAVMLITGTSRGIGRFLAGYYLERGMFVIGCSRGQCDISHERYRHFEVDVTDEEAVSGLFQSIRQDPCRLDILINNVGIASMNPVALTPVSSARKVMEANFIAPFMFSQRAIRLLRKSRAPRIINISSVAVPFRLEGEAVYAASKSAVETFTRILAKEVSGFGITCNAVGPGPIQTALIRGVGEEKIKALVARQSIKEMITFEDVANVMDFFIRQESRMVTGQVVYLGGAG